MKRLAFVCLLLCVFGPGLVVAQVNDTAEFPDPSRGASAGAILDAIEKNEQSIQVIRQDLKEFKDQVRSMLQGEINKLVLLFFLGLVAFYCFAKLLGRFYDKWSEGRWLKKAERNQVKILKGLEEASRGTQQLNARLLEIERQIAAIKIPAPKKAQERVGLFSRLKGLVGIRG